MTEYYIYIIKCEKWKRGIFQDDFYYTGMTSNVKRRLAEHKSGTRSAWMVKNGMSAKELGYVELVGSNYYDALKREKQIKRKPRLKKIELCKEYQN